MSTTPPLVSVALATYNGARFLERQLDSILAQDYPSVQVIACDDASTDGTRAILERYAETNAIELHIGERNLGFVANFERAISLCNGEYIALADQDDVWLPEKLTSLVAAIDDAGGTLVYSDATLVDESDQVVGESLWASLGVKAPDSDVSQALYVRNRVTGCTILFKRELLDVALPIPAGFPYHDWWLAHVAARLGGLVHHDSKPVRYRLHADNVIGAADQRDRRAGRSVAQRISSKLERQSRLTRSADEAIACVRAFLEFDAQQGLDTELSTALLRWSEDRKTRINLRGHQALFERNPGLFALEVDPADRQRRALVSIRRQRLDALLELLLPAAAVTLVLALAVAFVLRALSS